MLVAATIQSNLFERPPESPIVSAINWMVGVATGPLATAIGVIAIAWIGFAMLSGRVNLRRGLSVVLGCFVLFGARSISDGLRSLADGDYSQPNLSARPLPAPPLPRPVPAANTANAFDPYAGAAVVPNDQ